jgi:hypothetical protein
MSSIFLKEKEHKTLARKRRSRQEKTETSLISCFLRMNRKYWKEIQ